MVFPGDRRLCGSVSLARKWQMSGNSKLQGRELIILWPCEQPNKQHLKHAAILCLSGWHHGIVMASECLLDSNVAVFFPLY